MCIRDRYCVISKMIKVFTESRLCTTTLPKFLVKPPPTLPGYIKDNKVEMKFCEYMWRFCGRVILERSYITACDSENDKCYVVICVADY